MRYLLLTLFLLTLLFFGLTALRDLATELPQDTPVEKRVAPKEVEDYCLKYDCPENSKG